MSTAAAGGRRSSAPSSSTDAGVGPVEVVEHEHERPRLRELLEQLAHRAVAAVALVLGRTARPSASADSDGKTCASSACTSSSRAASRSGSRLATYSSSASTKTENGRSCSNSDADPTRTRCPRSSARAASSREQARLADPRLAHQLERAGPARVELVEQLLERVELVGAPDEGVGRAQLTRRNPVRHRASFGRYESLHDDGARVIRGRAERGQRFLRYGAATYRAGPCALAGHDVTAP